MAERDGFYIPITQTGGADDRTAKKLEQIREHEIDPKNPLGSLKKRIQKKGGEVSPIAPDLKGGKFWK